MLKTLLGKFKKPRPIGVTCEYCGWNGPKEDVFESKRMNENGTTYSIYSCPQCKRNGALVYHPEQVAGP